MYVSVSVCLIFTAMLCLFQRVYLANLFSLLAVGAMDNT